MLLVWKETEFPTEVTGGYSNLLETNRGLLQKNRSNQGKLRIAKTTVIASSRSPEMCPKKLPASQAIMILTIFSVRQALTDIH